PLVGEGWGGGSWLLRATCPPTTTPTPIPSPQGGSLRNWLVMMGFRTAAVGGGRDATASEGCLAYFLALRQLQDVTLPSSGQLEPALHVVGEPDEVQMRSILGEPDVADPIEAHPALECGEDALYLRPNR